MPIPIISHSDRCYYLLIHYRTKGYGNPKQNDATGSGEFPLKSKFAKVFTKIKGQEDTVFAIGFPSGWGGRQNSEFKI